MNVRVIELAKKIVTLKLRRFAITKTSSELITQTCIEHSIFQGKYAIEQAAISEIERFYDEYLAAPLRLYTHASNRIDASKSSVHEKKTKGGVFEALLSIVPLGDLHLTSGVIPDGIKAVISVPVENLVVGKIDKLVVIENSELLVQSDRLIETLPECWRKNALIMYRGHGQSQGQLKSVLKALKPTAQVAFYFDYDFAGMVLVNSFMGHVKCQASIITPRLSLGPLKGLSSDTNHAKQYIEGLHLLERTELSNDNYAQVIHQETLKLKEHELAVTQERLVAHNIELVSIPLNYAE